MARAAGLSRIHCGAARRERRPDDGCDRAGARDAEVAMGTLDELMRRYPALTRRAGVRRLRARLAGERDREARAILADRTARAAVLAELRAVRERAAAWNLSEQAGVEPF